MKKLMESIKSKRVRYGTFSTLMIVAVFAILIIVNLIASRLDLSFDMTVDDRFSISDQTKDILANLNQDVTIYVLIRTGDEAHILEDFVGRLTFREILREYAAGSRHVRIDFVDPYIHPRFALRFSEEGQDLPMGTVIVESGSRFRVLTPSDMVTMDFDMQRFQQFVRSIDIEPQLTNAINYVAAEDTPIVYMLVGYNEFGIPETLAQQMRMANYEIDFVQILTDDIPEDCAILLVTQPTRDWTESTAEKVRTYLNNGGRAMFLVDNFLLEMPILNSVLESFGVSVGNYVVVEGDSSNYARHPSLILPNLAEHEINLSVINRRHRVLLIRSFGIDILPTRRHSLLIEPLLTTTADAYGQRNTDPDAPLVRTEGDVEGPIDVAVAITESINQNNIEQVTKLVVVASAHIPDDEINSMVGGANYLFLINSLDWLQDREETVFIMPRTPRAFSQISMTQQQMNMITFLSIVVVPGAIIATGLIVWLRRRHS